MMKLPYAEATLFAVPLNPQGFALGLVARGGRKRGVALAYFFPWHYESIPSLESLGELDPKAAIKAIRISDYGLVKAEWPMLGKYEHFVRSDWPMPEFAMQQEFAGRRWVLQFSDDNPTEVVNRTLAEIADIAHLEPVEVYGAGAVETVLSKLIVLSKTREL